MSVGIESARDQATVPSHSELQAQVERILRSSGFSNTEILRNLLLFLANAAMGRPGEHVKEYEIATEVLARAKDFDPRLDSTVRVHTGRLRAKLTEYYQGEGASDPLILTVPKGAYHLSYTHRPAMPEAPETSRPSALPPRLWQERRWLLGWAVAALFAGTGIVMWLNQPPRLPETLRMFWSGFVENAGETVVVFSNPRFIGSAMSGMRYAAPGASVESQDLNDRYTGTGEAVSLHELTQLFQRIRAPIRVKRSQLLTWDEARSHNLVFVGGPDANHPQSELPRLQQFAFKTVDEGPRLGIGAVVNLHPGPGEERYYFDSGTPYTLDYAVIAMVPGLQPQRRALILAGATTYGTQAATEFVLDEDNVRALFQKLGVRSGKPAPFFEALVRVQVSGGVPVQPRLVMVRPRE